MPSSTFDQRRSTSIYWRNKSNDLLGAAGLVWLGIQSDDQPKAEQLGFPDWYRFSTACPSVFRMLCGMAIELLIKAIIIQGGCEPAAIHDLNKLAEYAALPVDSKTAQLLKILSESIIWDGRYPVPKTKQHYSTLRSLQREVLADRVPLGSFYVLHPNGVLDWENFLGVWNQFNEVYLKESGQVSD